MAKRSPILGYNHNVRYRGLGFHVQTEDSGVLSPHLFTHLFYEGVIISTRKLVYDAGASEDAIKALMQAQHKAVLKDLNKHTFDDKIDQYLGGTPGLEPRASAAVATPRPSDPEITVEPSAPEPPPTAPESPRVATEPNPVPPVEAPEPRARRKSGAPPVEEPTPAVTRAKTAERTSRSSQFRSMPPPPPPEDDAATLLGSDAAVMSAMTAQAAATVPTQTPPPQPKERPTPPPTPQRPALTRAATPPPIPMAARSKPGIPITPDSSPEIEIIQHEENSGRSRAARDTAVDNPYEDGVPAAIGPDATIPSDGVPGRIGDSIPPLPPAPGRSTTPTSRPASHGAATLPAVRPPSRPAITPASVVSRPLSPEQRARGDSDAVEVYAPAPASVEPPPGERAERPGQYSMSRRVRGEQDIPMREHTGRVAIPAGLGRPRGPNQSQPVRTASASSPPATSPIVPESMRGVPTPVSRPQSSSDGIPRTKTPSTGSDGVPREDSKPVPPSRSPHLTAPMSSRTGTGTGPTGPAAPAKPPSSVITTRPAVIVGAPPKTPGSPTPQRVRKAREDEGRGFGQGLISEKSLDEVILAYLSEDADEK